MKKSLPVFILLVHLFSFLNTKADKIFKFSYDDNGNRTVLTFVSTCRIKKPTDTIPPKEDTLAVIDSLDLLIKEIAQVNIPTVYPTLVHDYFTVSLPYAVNNGTLQLVDMHGNIVFTETGINTSDIIVKTCDIPNGMYNIVMNDGSNKPFVQKIVKQ